ncbi:type II secretion system protein GspL [Saccharospirillum mangrovi]|uniref:type II secretion system protein GspL n=1 Tax=Saccharospirillum mangrovi TaxID=2161747 RepID=UPI000D34CF23|nr:type II secretion system protein GspL [Saccharospirillum mangrovi]
MTPELSIYWLGLGRLEWRWHSQVEAQQGRWDDLVDEVRERNRTGASVRLYLPHVHFTALTIKVPLGRRRLSPAILRFTAEEQLAQDIDSLHLVPLDQPQNGQLTVLVVESDWLSNLKTTLAEGGLNLVEAFDAGYFQWPTMPVSDVQLDLDEQRVLCRHNALLHQTHIQGFAQWFESFKHERGLASPLKLALTSRTNDERARQLRTELEAAGDELEWVVSPLPTLAEWDEQCRQSKGQGNLMTGVFAVRAESGQSRRWLPTAVAASLVLGLWMVVSGFNALRDQQQADATWAASEAVFRQVFGADKRIQRPLMVREMDNRILTQNGGQSDTDITVITALDALRVLDDALVLDDFRFQQNAGLMLFTLRQPASAEGDAFARFEATKTALQDKGYEVEYSASQDSQAVRGRFQVRLGDNG